MSTESIKVKITKYKDRKNWTMYYDDPLSGKRKTKSAKTPNEKTAIQNAAKWEAELQEGRYAPKNQATWDEFTFRFRCEVFPTFEESTRSQLNTVFGTIERFANPKKMTQITAAKLSHVASQLRKEGKEEITIKNYLSHFKSSLEWAVDQDLLRSVPKFPKIKCGKSRKAKGRPISLEEFERMLEKVPYVLSGNDLRAVRMAQGKKTLKVMKVATEDAVDSWRWYLWGLWYSGLRLGESLDLYWNRSDMISVEMNDGRPLLRIPGERQKNGKDQLYSVAPEFGKMLVDFPENLRRGRVFKLLGLPNGEGQCPIIKDGDYVSHVVSRIGRAAGVIVSTKTKADANGGTKQVVKYASAHDLRRSFGTRWSSRVMPNQLKELMRHADIQTTMEFYVEHNAKETVDKLWAALENGQTIRS